MIKVKQVAKVKCLNSLLFHTRYFFKNQYGRKFVVGDHHRIIWDALEKVLRGEIKRLIINVAPRYSKTELVVKSLIPHGLALNPAAKFIHLSYSDDLAKDNSEAAKDTVQSAEYQELFPDVQIKKDSKAKDKWNTTAGGGVLARAAAGQVTGFGAGQVDTDEDKDFNEFLEGITEEEQSGSRLDKKFKFGGAILIDDPLKPEDANQDTIREKVNNRFDSTIRNRVNSRNTPIIIIMQRLHPNDLCGYLQRTDEADDWTVISLPCIKEDGTALWPFKHTVEELKKLKKANDIVFENQYMQNPKPKEGLMFPADDLNYHDRLPEEFDYLYLPVDPANLGGDDFAAPLLGLKAKEKRIYVIKTIYNTMGADYNEDEVVKMIQKDRPHAVGIEGVLGWAETVKRVQERCAKFEYPGEIRNLRPRTAKHVRISARSAFIRNYFSFWKGYDNDPQYMRFMQNLTSYKRIQTPGMENKHDEAPDVCEMGAAYFEKNFPELWV